MISWDQVTPENFYLYKEELDNLNKTRALELAGWLEKHKDKSRDPQRLSNLVDLLKSWVLN